jgi:hypothetical protein
MDKLAVFNIIGVVASALLAATAALLGVVAVATGSMQAVPLYPQWHLFGDTSVKIAMGLAGVIPVVLNCYVGHQNLFPLMDMLKPYSVKAMAGVSAAALAGSCGIFWVLAAGTVVAFGSAVDFNVLNNLSQGGMAGLLGGSLAQVGREGNCEEGRSTGVKHPRRGLIGQESKGGEESEGRGDQSNDFTEWGDSRECERGGLVSG